MPPHRVFKSQSRRSGNRDSRLIVVATEGTVTEKRYFDGITDQENFRDSRIHVEILPRLDSHTDPSGTLRLLDSFKDTYELKLTDELWLVIDVDRWGPKKLNEIARLCKQKTYKLAISNPCFELWLLLHFQDISVYTIEEQKRILANPKINQNRSLIESELVRLLNGYSKTQFDVRSFVPYVGDAVTRAKLLDTNPRHRWPNKLGTRVFRLIDSIISLKKH